MSAPLHPSITERIPMVGATVKTELPIVICELDAIADQRSPTALFTNRGRAPW